MGSRPISLDNGLVLLVFDSSFGLAQILHKLVQYPVILDGYPSNKIYVQVHATYTVLSMHQKAHTLEEGENSYSLSRGFR